MSKPYLIKIETDLNKLHDIIDIIQKNTSYEHVLHVVSDLKDTMYAHKDLVALCAPQIGDKLRLFCIKFDNGDIRTFLNPLIVHSSGLHLSRETNASIPGKEYIIPRNDIVQVTYQTVDGHIDSVKFEDYASEMVQQMIQMLDGVTLDMYGLEVLDGFDIADVETRKEIINMYLDHLQKLNDNLQKEINDTPELNRLNKAIDFLTNVNLGKVTIEKDCKVSKEEIESYNKAVEEQLTHKKKRGRPKKSTTLN